MDLLLSYIVPPSNNLIWIKNPHSSYRMFRSQHLPTLLSQQNDSVDLTSYGMSSENLLHKSSQNVNRSPTRIWGSETSPTSNLARKSFFSL